jgi:hypothetical protein
LELEDAFAVASAGIDFSHDCGACDVGGHEVGGELDARELQVEGLGKRADEEGFADAGNAFEQNVTAAEEAGEHAFDDFALADDDSADLLAHGFKIFAECVGGGLRLFWSHGGSRLSARVGLGHGSRW